MTRTYDAVKRVVDLSVAGTGLVVTLPLQVVLGGVIRQRLGSPVLFRQVRPGRHGKPFIMVKFRSMADVDEARGLVTDEQRLTHFGKVLRSTSLDELPTLWNVVKGEMSLIGPRPLLMEYLDRYTPEQARRHEVRPGITGLAQVSGRNEVPWDERFILDVEYVDNRSAWLDLRILWRTLAQVFTRAGISESGHATMSKFGVGGTVTPSVVVIGCGGQGREIGRMLTDNGIQVVGYIDDQPSELNLARVADQRLRYHGGRDALGSAGATHYIAGIASGRVRELLAPLAEAAGLAAFTFVHPDATVGSDCVVGAGSVLWAGARLTTNVRLGRHVHINQNVTIGHDSMLEDFVTVNPSAAVSGNVVVARRALLGAASVVLQERSVGHDATVGAAACLTRDLPPLQVAVGVPARSRPAAG